MLLSITSCVYAGAYELKASKAAEGLLKLFCVYAGAYELKGAKLRRMMNSCSVFTLGACKKSSATPFCVYLGLVRGALAVFTLATYEQHLCLPLAQIIPLLCLLV